MQKHILTLLLIFCTGLLTAQEDVVKVYPPLNRISGEEVEPRKSPMAVTSLLNDEGYVKITYSQPHLRGRKMLGGDAVPYGKVWRLGANEATELFTTTEFEIGDKELKKGAYSLFAIPGETEWTLIANSDLGLWGAYSYDEDNDLFRVSAPTRKSDRRFEAFTIWFSEDGSELNMAWGDTMVSWPVELDD